MCVHHNASQEPVHVYHSTSQEPVCAHTRARAHTHTHWGKHHSLPSSSSIPPLPLPPHPLPCLHAISEGLEAHISSLSSLCCPDTDVIR